jgi:GNAT superfamily N-acetyltransferase
MGRYSFLEETMDPVAFNYLRKKVGWEEHEIEDIRTALKNTLYSVVSRNEKGELIGMARIIGDAGMYYYIQDVIVIPEYQNMGIGKELMERIMGYIDRNKKKALFIGLMAAKGKEGFYKRYGFAERPAENYGAGMCKVCE